MRVVILVLMVSILAVAKAGKSLYSMSSNPKFYSLLFLLLLLIALETRAVANLCRQTCHEKIKDDELVGECKMCCNKCCGTGGQCMMFLFFTGDDVEKRCMYDVDPGNRSDEGISVECKLDHQK